MKKHLNIGLQFFADAGTLVNATTGYVNAYEGTKTDFDSVKSRKARPWVRILPPLPLFFGVHINRVIGIIAGDRT